jgi:hypothetical protein
MISPRWLVFVIALLTAAGAAEKRPITPQDLWTMKRAGRGE